MENGTIYKIEFRTYTNSQKSAVRLRDGFKDEKGRKPYIFVENGALYILTDDLPRYLKESGIQDYGDGVNHITRIASGDYKDFDMLDALEILNKAKSKSQQKRLEVQLRGNKT